MKNICIIGNGIIGMMSSLLLEKYFNNIYLIVDKESNKKSNKTQRYFSINLLSKYMFLKTDIWQDLISNGTQSYNKIVTWDEDIREDLIFQSSSISYDNLGYIISESKIKDLLINKIDQATKIKKIDIKDIGKIDIYDEITKLRLNSEEIIDCDLLLNSDIKISQFLEVKLPDKTIVDYEQKALVMNLNMSSAVTSNTAYQRFSKGHIQGLLPISDDMYNLIWSAENPFIDDLKLKNPKMILEILNGNLSRYIGKIKTLSSFATFPLSGFHVKKYFYKSAAVIGGVAHSVHPMAGLGLNMGIQDIFLLNQALLENNGNSKDMDFVLSTYDEYCSYENSKIFNTINFLKKFYSKNALPSTVKSSSISLFNRNNFIKNKVIENATGIDVLKRRSRDQYCYPNYNE
tara:strand:- start:738 stop:1946 length:1209 start_codon:yes stop_codon:yes gene_type:complete